MILQTPMTLRSHIVKNHGGKLETGGQEAAEAAVTELASSFTQVE